MLGILKETKIIANEYQVLHDLLVIIIGVAMINQRVQKILVDLKNFNMH